LASSIVSVGNGAGVRTSAVLTDMNESLCPSAGNALEVRLALDYLSGKSRPTRLHEVTLALCAEMLVLAGLAADLSSARRRLQQALDSGAAAERFARMVRALGGPSDLFERPDAHLEAAPVVLAVAAPHAGYAMRCDCRALGMAVVSLGGGRTRPSDGIDYAVGLSELVALGEPVQAGQTLALVHARSESAARDAMRRVLAAYTLSEQPGAARPLIYETLRPETRTASLTP
jgi:thymidine phosphorylase